PNPDERPESDQENDKDTTSAQNAEDSQDTVTDFDAGSAHAESKAGASHKDSRAGSTGGENILENTVSDKKTLREHLLEQLHVDFRDPRDRMVGAMLIEQIDESGYLRDEPKALAEKVGCSVERINDLLPKLKQFDPTGIFAKDLTECLALQLEEKELLGEGMRRLLDNLHLLGEHDYKQLSKICEVDVDIVKEMAEDIRTLSPKPTVDFDHSVTQTVVPDILMKKLPREVGGGWKVELNADTLPRVLVNNDYYTTVKSKAVAKKDKEYLSTQMQAASWLVRALDQRAQTILKTAAALIEEQDGFFLYGVEFLKPLTLKDIADEIEMHESTVSRVTNNKYIGTPRGIFELKYFFSSSIASSDGSDAYSSESVKAKIKNLIDAEDVNAVLSDDAIVNVLQEEGVDIARRTVAKYREAMNIPSSVQRRRIKKNLSE
ncbi:MAG: RNA polymerase factor sigma-54, partial [Bdellovibrionales bacterium]